MVWYALVAASWRRVALCLWHLEPRPGQEVYRLRGAKAGPMTKKKELYLALCARCAEDGVRTVVAWSSMEGSSGGICAKHLAEQAEQIRRRQERRKR